MNRTKDMICESFSQLLDEKPISKITIKDIVTRCGVNRNTFYYHFRDVPDLCEYIWKQKIDELIDTHFRPGSPEEIVAVAIGFFHAHKVSVMHIFKSLPRGIFLRYLDRLAIYLVQEYIDTATAYAPLSAEDHSFVVRYYKCVLVGIFLDWLDSNMSYDLMKMALLICDLRSDSGRTMLEQLRRNSSAS